MTEQVALLADIGGTHARFALLRSDQTIVETQIIAGGNFTGMADVCHHYLAMVSPHYTITKAAWAVAGPLIDGRQTITNRGWSFSVRDMQRTFGWADFQIVNDFAALALSLPHLSDDDKILIKPGIADPQAPVAVVGPGTGLGVAGLVPFHDGTWRVLPGEGGHVTLPGETEQEDAIIAHLRQRFGIVIAERVLSGRGLLNLYDAIAAVEQVDAQAYHTPQALAQAALSGTDALAVRTLDRFFGFLGTVAGNVALTLGARGGLYLAGGILPHMADALLQSAFSTRFAGKGVVAPYLEAVPVWLVTHPLPAFIGLKFLLQRQGS